MILAGRMHRLGTESAFEVLARAHKLAQQGRDIINLGIGQPDFPTPPNIVAAAQKALADGHHGYTPANGILPLREAVAEDIARHSRRRDRPRPDRDRARRQGHHVLRDHHVWRAGRRDHVPDPGFPIYRSVIEFSGAKAVPIPLYEESGFSFSAEEVLAKIAERTRLIIVNSPANPTGGVVPKEELDTLVEGLERHPHVMVLPDEIYARMVYDNMPHASMTVYPELEDRLILLDGWSKTYAMTGWRLGYAVWPKDLVDHATRLAIDIHSCVNAATQYAGIEALKGPQEAVLRGRRVDERRQVIVERLNALPGFRCVRPGGAFYAFPNIAATGFSRELQDDLLKEAGVALVAGTSFGDQGEGYIRFSYANSVENIERAIERIASFLGG